MKTNLKNVYRKIIIVLKLRDEIDGLKKKCEGLEQINKKLEELQRLNGRIDEIDRLKKDIEELRKLINGMNIHPNDSTSKVDFSDLEKLRTDLLNALLSKSDFKTLEARVGMLEGITSKQTKEQERTNERLKLLEQQMLKKVNIDEFDKLILQVNTMKRQLEAAGRKKVEVAPSSTAISAKELDQIRSMANRIAELEARLNYLSK